MNKAWKVFWYEYSRHVLRKRFLFAVFSIPFFVAVVIGISIFVSVSQTDQRPIGYVDPTGLLADPVPFQPEDSFFDRPLEMRPYATETEGMAAVERGEVQAVYMLSPTYLQDGKVRMVAQKSNASQSTGQFRDFLLTNLLKSQPAGVAQRILEGSQVTIQTPDGARSMGENDWFNILVPYLAGVLFMVVVFTSGGYLMQSLVEEKENRTMEMLITSLSPGQLMAGKVLGNLSVGLTQLLIWLAFIVIGVLIGRTRVEWISRIQFSWDYLLLLVLTLLPTFVMIAGLMAAIGAMVSETREAQQMSSMFSLPMAVPYWFSYALMSNPNGPLAVGLSFFPLTAPIALTMRAGFTQIPVWQLAINIGVLVLAAVLSVWIAGRAFRLGLLNYGKRLAFRQLFQRGGAK